MAPTTRTDLLFITSLVVLTAGCTEPMEFDAEDRGPFDVPGDDDDADDPFDLGGAVADARLGGTPAARPGGRSPG